MKNDLVESNNLNESMLSSLNTYLPNKSKFARTTKKYVRKSPRLCVQRIHEVSDKKIVMDFLETLSDCRDDNDNPDLVKQNKMCELKFKWIPVYKDGDKDGELIRKIINCNCSSLNCTFK